MHYGDGIKETVCHLNYMASKSILLYSVVVLIGKENIPICEMISSNHNGVTIGNLFRKFRYDGEIVNKVK